MRRRELLQLLPAAGAAALLPPDQLPAPKPALPKVEPSKPATWDGIKVTPAGEFVLDRVKVIGFSADGKTLHMQAIGHIESPPDLIEIVVAFK